MSILKESPALLATTATGCAFIVALVPGLNILVLILVMLPLWVIDNKTAIDLGEPLHGFFVPNKLGWTVVAGAFWLFWFFIGVNTRRHLLKSKSTAT